MNNLSYSNTVMQEYVKNAEIDPASSNTIIYLINIILFGSVIIFMGVFVWNFYKAYKGKEEEIIVKKSGKTTNSMKNRVESHIQKNNRITCNICGETNEYNSKYCKNCGNKL